MTINVSNRWAVGRSEYATFTMEELVENFLVTDLFQADHIELVYTHYDRFVVGGVMPVKETVSLGTVDELRAEYFLERRELGVINVGGPGKVSVDAGDFDIAHKEGIYIGRGTRKIEFSSDDAKNPAKFYFNSVGAHQDYPTKKIGLQDAEVMPMGDAKTCNERVINKLIVTSTVDTCQLQMGMTELKPGSVWNTMPAHTHARRMETYFYFEVDDDQAISHFMGPREETRHVWVGNNEAVVSPPWSIHSGVGTSNYTFIWGMAGENVDYADMDTFQPNEFRASAQ
ncbi:MAG: 5-dehydro-4-deoxy-D-glucuronate isomerase [Woeseiaceae bacterium]|jgi:4-deoxy-L-threo-5-hexosulose-uronate ketol-isomerase